MTDRKTKKTSSPCQPPTSPAHPTPDEIACIVVNLVKLLMSPKSTSGDIIRYLEQYHINPNISLPNLQCDTQLPLIYYCVSNPKFDDLFEYLMSHGVQLNLMMESDRLDNVIELLYYSQIKYIPTLIKNGCRLNPDKIRTSIERMLILGNINKVIVLYKCGALTKEQLQPLVHQPGLIFKILDQLYEKIFRLSQQITDKQQFLGYFEDILKNYVNTFKFFFKNGVLINQMDDGESFIQKVLNTYFFPLIQLMINQGQANWETAEFMHYSNFGLTNRQVMKFIYNDDNYRQIDDYLREHLPPRKIIIKKAVTKKIISD